MNETSNGNVSPPKKGKSKRVMLILIVLLLIAGGSVAAYVLLQPSDKEKYFLAEKDTMEFLTETFQERYEPETKWKEQKESYPINTELALSAEYNNPFGDDYGIADMINNASVTIETSTDKKKKQFASELKAQFAGINIDGFHFYLTEDQMMAGFPFIDDILQVKSDDLSTLLHELDPDSFSGKEEFDFGDFFDPKKFITKNIDMDHFKDEYVQMIYDELPESAFAVTKDNVNVQNKSVKAEKITFHLSEKELKSLLNKTIRTMQHDKVLKEMIRDQFHLDFLTSASDLDPMLEDKIDIFIEEFDEELDELKSGISDLKIPGGFTSTIWEKDNIIVKRDFSLSIGPSTDQVITLSVKGEQLLSKEKQLFDYTIAVPNVDGNQSVSFKGDLSSTDGKINDSMKLATDVSEVTYESEETLKDGTREYERVITTDNNYEGRSSFIWNGEATYNKDKMSSENSFAFEAPDLSQDMFKLHVSKESKTIKKVDLPSGNNVKNIGKMDMMELNNYFEMDVVPKAQQWMYQLMGGGLLNGGF